MAGYSMCPKDGWVNPVCVGGTLYPDFDGWSRNDGGGWKEVRLERKCLSHISDYALYVAMRDSMSHIKVAKAEWQRRYPSPIGGTGYKGWAKSASQMVDY